jgi:hypothetical protein
MDRGKGQAPESTKITMLPVNFSNVLVFKADFAAMIVKYVQLLKEECYKR